MTAVCGSAFQCNESVPHLRDALYPDDLAFFLCGIHGRRTEISTTPFQTSGYTTLRKNDRMCADGQGLAYTDLSPEDHSVSDLYGSGHCNLRGKETIASNDRIMSNVNHVVHLRSRTDMRVMRHAPINGT